MIANINKEVFGEDTKEGISIEHFINGFVDAVNGTCKDMEYAQQIVQEKMQLLKRYDSMDEFADNKAAGVRFLEENKSKEGVCVLSSGVQYKVIKEGNGEIPNESSMVIVHYEGKTIDGKVFDSSYNGGTPIKIKLNQVIPGWTEVLCLMPVGSIWEVLIPEELAYGERVQGEIKPFSALIFKIELIGIEK